MPTRILSASIQGIDAQLVEVEVDSTPGIHAFNIVGLPDKAIEESQDRIGAAIRNSGLTPPQAKNKKFIINLAPADLKKEGPAYDLPIAVGYLLESGQIKFDPTYTLFAGEVSLDGSLKHTNGILAMALLAKRLGLREIIIPAHNAQEALVVPDIKVSAARTISEVINHLHELAPLAQPKPEPITMVSEENPLLFIHGQAAAKRALTIAAAGAHNMLMNGAPGSGKTLLAKSLSYLMPPLSWDEAIEVAKIYSSVGLLKGSPLHVNRPFRSPHHTTSPAAVVGGGSWPRPGEISLAHRGVLFLDELPEFPRNVLESLRQPLEDGTITIARASGSIVLPAKFTFVAAMNPCPCGNYGDEAATCVCLPFNVVRYRKKVSGPLLDRIDIQTNVPRETIRDDVPRYAPEVTTFKDKVIAAREIQHQRLTSHGLFTNSEINYKNIDALCILSPPAENLLKYAINAKGLSLRAYHKIKKLGRTIADLEASPNIEEHHIAEALGLRINETLNPED